MSIRGLRKDENQGTFFRRSRVSGLTVAQVALDYLMRSIVPAASPQLRRTNAAAPSRHNHNATLSGWRLHLRT